MPPKTTSPKKPAPKREAAPVIHLVFNDPELASIYDALESHGKDNERNPTAQARHIIREWAAKL